MKVFVQDLKTGLFIDSASAWRPKEEAYSFATVAFAVEMCVVRRLRGVRIIVDSGDPEADVFLDVHGYDRGSLLRAMRTNQKLQEEQRKLLAELDETTAESKEQKRKFPFKRRRIAKREDRERED